jgi:hypothetical protein
MAGSRILMAFGRPRSNGGSAFTSSHPPQEYGDALGIMRADCSRTVDAGRRLDLQSAPGAASFPIGP